MSNTTQTTNPRDNDNGWKQPYVEMENLNPTYKVSLTVENSEGHELRILNRFNAMAVESANKADPKRKNIHVECLDIPNSNKFRIRAIFGSSVEAKNFEATLGEFIESDHRNYGEGYTCKLSVFACKI